MALEVQGIAILSQGEFVALTKGLPEGYTGSGVLQGLWAGEDYHPATVHAAFNIELRFAAVSAEAEDIIDLVVQRLERGLSHDSPGSV